MYFRKQTDFRNDDCYSDLYMKERRITKDRKSLQDHNCRKQDCRTAEYFNDW